MVADKAIETGIILLIVDIRSLIKQQLTIVLHQDIESAKIRDLCLFHKNKIMPVSIALVAET